MLLQTHLLLLALTITHTKHMNSNQRSAEMMNDDELISCIYSII